MKETEQTPEENTAHSFTESAYKEGEPSAPQENLKEAMATFSRKLMDLQKDMPPDIANFVNENFNKLIEPVSAPSESQEELWKEVVDAFYYCSTNKQYFLAEQAIKKKFTITRKPE